MARPPQGKGYVTLVRLSAKRRKQKSWEARIWATFLRAAGVVLACSLVAGEAFGAGGHLAIVQGVGQVKAPQNLQTHPACPYSAPLGQQEGSRRVIGTIFGSQNRKTAPLAQMPPHLLNALMAKEDERFRENGGADVWAFMRALYVDIRACQAVEGAVTITQQYVKRA